MAFTVTRSGVETCGTSCVTIVRNTIRSCSTLLCVRLCTSAGGVPSVVPYRNTAVPGTRSGGSAARSASSILSATVFSSMRFPRISRPRCHVVISRKMTAAIAKGTQPPERIFSMFAPKNGTSTHKNSPATTAARAKLQRHTSRLIT